MICFEKGLQIAEECEFKHMKVLFLSNMGVAYKNMRELRKSNAFFEKSLSISTDI